MTTHYHLYCMDCKEQGLEHAPRILRELVTHADAIASVRELQKKLNIDLQLDSGTWIYPEWFANHKGHHLVLRDEYGRIEGQCSKQAKCSRCGHPENCILRDGHEPPCKIKADVEAEATEAADREFFSPVDPPVVAGGG